MSKEICNQTSNLTSFIEKTIHYKFKNEQLLSRAFTHKSMSNINYERLELLGDAIIRLVITHYLYSQYEMQTKEAYQERFKLSLVKMC